MSGQFTAKRSGPLSRIWHKILWKNKHECRRISHWIHANSYWKQANHRNFHHKQEDNRRRTNGNKIWWFCFRDRSKGYVNKRDGRVNYDLKTNWKKRKVLHRMWKNFYNHKEFETFKHQLLTHMFQIDSFCGNWYSYEIALTSHLKTIHEIKPQVQCQEYFKAFGGKN